MKVDDIELINLTPHTIRLQLADGRIVEIAGTINPARIDEEKVLIGMLGNIPLWRKRFTKLNYEIPRKEKTYYLVSMPVAQAMKRDDLLIVNDVIRDVNGNVCYAKSLSIVAG